jgi:hypothetical protein
MCKRTGLSRTAAIGATALLVVAGFAAVALAAGGAADSRAPRVRVRCPRRVIGGSRVTCRVVGRLPRGPRGARGAQGPKGPKGAKGPTGARGPAGVSGYQVVSQTFKEVPVENSGGVRGLSEVKTVSCPGGKRVIGGGADLGTNPAQNGQQRQVAVSLSGPNGGGNGWSVQLFNNSTTTDTAIDLEVFAICASAG